VLYALALDFGAADQFYAALVEPHDELAEGLQRILLMRLDDDADTTNSGLDHLER